VNLPPSYLFDPRVIQVVAATTVTWTKNDHFAHSVTVGEVIVPHGSSGASGALCPPDARG
jgi:plastocyanin